MKNPVLPVDAMVVFSIGWKAMDRIKKGTKINTLQSAHRERKLDCLNFCVSGLMSRCSAGSVWEDQQRCKFYEKSTISNRCMYYIEAIDGHCDCVDAQKEIRMRECAIKDR